ncbi:glutathione S-transferase N-terminal domain-containing protein [Sneathiella litorea]|uniref:Glutathione S-transferase n=1 Tax=Sneathiella litorea TaxID=2606216 RepID=A0A6L8WB53_9PROT|nr:glutathione S-transferase [Sneathiella litorea]
MKLYDLPASPNARRVRIFLAEKGLEIPKEEVDLSSGYHHTPEYLSKNILGRMPVLELADGSTISESQAICRYLEEIYPEPPLMGQTPLERAHIEMWNRRMELELLIPLMHAFVHGHPMWKGIRDQVPDYVPVCEKHASRSLGWLETALEGREYIAAPVYSVADITAQCAILMGKAVGVRPTEDQENINAWWARVTSRPSARA